jgi:hypothetical protein
VFVLAVALSAVRLGAGAFHFRRLRRLLCTHLRVQIDPQSALRWQLDHCSAGVILDTPPGGRWQEFRACLAATVAATKAALPLYLSARQRSTAFRWSGIIQGRTTDELETWYRAIAKVYSFTDAGEGWAFKPMTDAGRANDPEAMRRVLAFIEKHGIRRAHFFATAEYHTVDTLAFYGPRVGLSGQAWTARVRLSTVLSDNSDSRPYGPARRNEVRR